MRTGGLVKEKYQEEKFRNVMRQITDIFNLEVPMDVDYSEVYQMDKVSDDFRQIRYVNLYTRTLIDEVWAKEDFLEMTTDEGGVVYG